MASAKLPTACPPARAESCGCASPESCLRCACGSLLARFVNGQLELKCRRCKRTVMVTMEEEPGVDSR